MVKITISLFLVLFGFQNMAHAQKSTIVEDSAACSSYHRAWNLLSKQSNSINDANFSMRIADALDARFKNNQIYTNAQARSLDVLSKAFKSGNTNMLMSFQAICQEIGQPVGQNTKR